MSYYDLEWIVVTHVCSHWRWVALDHSALWANFDLKIGSQWSEEMIQRAKLTPLIINFTGAKTTLVNEMAVDILHLHLVHIAELYFFGEQPYITPVIEALTLWAKFNGIGDSRLIT